MDDVTGFKEIAKIVDAMPDPFTVKETSGITPILDDIDTVKQPPRIDKQAFEIVNGQGARPSLIADFVQLACLNSEASPEAVALNTIVYFSALIGREKIVYRWADTFIDARPSVLLVGKSGSNKGISEHFVNKAFIEAQQRMRHKIDFQPLDIRSGGLNSGEGLIQSLRDETEPGAGDGVNDKRALIVEPEFSKVLAVSNREGATLSGTLRNFHDGLDQRNTTKANPSKCTNPHLVMMAHITQQELLNQLKATDLANGFMNRFMVCNVVQDKDVPNPTPAPKEAFNAVVQQLVEVMEFVNQGQTMTESECFKAKFESIYSTLRHPKGTLPKQQLLARSPKYTRMLAMIFALMEKQTVITNEHLNAALVYIRYWWKSVSFIFENDVEVMAYEKTKGLSEKVLEAITKIHGDSGKCTKTDISNTFNRKVTSKDINAALSILLESMPPKIKQEVGERVNGGVAPKLYRPAKKAK